MALPRIERPATALAIAPSLPLPETPKAAAQELRVVRELESGSGAVVTLGVRGRQSVVRKSARTADQNESLMSQAARQRLLAAYGIPVPRVLLEGLDEEGLAFFEMDYVPAQSLAAAIKESAPIDQEAVIAAIDRMLWVFRANTGPSIPAESFLREIARTAELCAGRRPTDAFGEAIGAAAQRLSLSSFEGIPVSPSHGALSFDNILIGQGARVVFIDCEEPFASSYWLDLAKLFQDIEGHWCLRDLHLAGETGAVLRDAEQKLAELAPSLRALAQDSDPALPPRLSALAALHLFRTLPTVKSEALTRLVLSRLDHLLASAG